MKYKNILFMLFLITNTNLPLSACEKPNNTIQNGVRTLAKPCTGANYAHTDRRQKEKTHSQPNSPSSRSSGYHHSTSVPTGLEAIPESNTPPQTATQPPLPGQVFDEGTCLCDTLQRTRSAPNTPRRISPSTSRSSDMDGTNTPSVDIRIAHLEVQLQKMKLEVCRCTEALSIHHEQTERELNKRINEQKGDATKQKERIENLARRYEDHVASCSKLLCDCSTSNIDCRRDIVTQTAWHDHLDTRVKTLEENVAGLIHAVHEIQSDLVTIGSNERNLKNSYDLLVAKSEVGALNENSIPVIKSKKTDNLNGQPWHWKTLFTCCLARSARKNDSLPSSFSSEPTLEAPQKYPEIPAAPNEIEVE
ncbi:MAG: hypothetical protein U1E02_36165 [Hydrogenophaga sp.]|nr:hypothetical protein [Hydrogenophaga sp.]